VPHRLAHRVFLWIDRWLIPICVVGMLLAIALAWASG
jgi:hypothetical protein